jgi:hypothetical protein
VGWNTDIILGSRLGYGVSCFRIGWIAERISILDRALCIKDLIYGSFT